MLVFCNHHLDRRASMILLDIQPPYHLTLTNTLDNAKRCDSIDYAVIRIWKRMRRATAKVCFSRGDRREHAELAFKLTLD